MGRQKNRKPKKSRPKGQRQSVAAKRPIVEELGIRELRAIVARAALGALCADDHRALSAAMSTLTLLTLEIEAKNASIKRLRDLLFGSSSEKASRVLGASSSVEGGGEEDASVEGCDAGQRAADSGKSKPKRKGHGRNSAAAYTGAEKVCVSHEALEAGERCPACGMGKLYLSKPPKTLVRITGMAPLSATVYELERLRCNLCGEVFVANEPAGVGAAKYDESATSMIALLKYGTGVPFNRLENLQVGLGIPLPSSTQWGLVESAANLLLPAYQQLVRQAAQGEVLHNDDTTMKILMLTGERKRKAIAAGDLVESKRVGIFTSGVVAVGATGAAASHPIALFFTGTKHAGENLATVLAERATELDAPIQMCDALSHNTAGDFETTVAHCLAHARRKFVEIVDRFPEECRFVIESLAKVYCNDTEAKKRRLSAQDRLTFHRKESRRELVPLKRWMRGQISEHKTEPNSCLGQAITYTLKHWQALTLFLRVPGAPLDNNVCERVLKKAILHRKNAYFYMSENGARVGDLFMSLIHTAELNKASPFEFLSALQLHHEAARSDPASWMPWNYTAALPATAAKRE